MNILYITLGCKTVETEDVARDVISLEIIVHTTQYVGKKTKCPCCNKEYSPRFPSNVKSTINYSEDIKELVVYLNSYCNVPNQKVVELLGVLSDDKIKASIISKETELEIVVEPDTREWQPDLTYQYKNIDEMKEYFENNGVYPINEKRKWETKEQLKNRVMSVIDKYKEIYDTIIVVAHKMVFQSICDCGEMKPAEIFETIF